MRRVRTLVVGSALGFAALTMAAPLASASDNPRPGGGIHQYDNGRDDNGRGDDHGRSDRCNNDRGDDHGRGDENGRDDRRGGYGNDDRGDCRPHGGVHAGVGGSFLNEGTGLATGGALLAGGLGLGYYAMKRRPAAAAARA